MRCLWVLMVVALIGGCRVGEEWDVHSPYVVIHAPEGDRVPMAVPGEDGFYSYLPVVLGMGCSEAEYPLFSALNVAPVGENKGVLKALRLIQQQDFSGGAAKGDRAASSIDFHRMRLYQRYDFKTAAGGRRVWLFRGSIEATGIPVIRRLLVLTDDRQRVIAYKWVMMDSGEPLPTVIVDGESLVLTFENGKVPNIVRVSDVALEASADVGRGSLGS